MSCVRPALGRTSLSHKGRSTQVQSTKGPEFGRGLGWLSNQPVRPGIGAYKAKERPGPLRGVKNLLDRRPSLVGLVPGPKAPACTASPEGRALTAFARVPRKRC